MRIIKFRAFVNGDMINIGGAFLASYLNVENEPDMALAHPIMQFTGLKDMNGKDIYEGDMVIFTDWAHEEPREIIWENGGFTYENTFYDCEGMLYSEKTLIMGNKYEK